MTDEEKLTMLKSMTEETDNDVLSTYLTLATVMRYLPAREVSPLR